ncbi:MAG: DUF4271 domain-containing protein [Bacteroidales bacterium]|nr:DUF4271 domain-containing protein [Candidatus Physcousia equi]
MLQTDTIVQDFDTLTKAAQALTDTVAAVHHTTIDTLAHTTAGTDTMVVDTLVPLHDSLPVLLWGDTLVTPAPLFDQMHAHGLPSPYNLLRDPWAVGLLFAAFMLLCTVFICCRGYLASTARCFFMPTNNEGKQKEVRTPAQVWAPIFIFLTIAANGGLLVTAKASQTYDLFAGTFSPLSVVGVCVACFAAYHTLRRLLYSFVNWIFFEPPQRRQWTDAFSFLLVLEGGVMLALFGFALNSAWNFENTLIVGLVGLGILRFLLLCYSFRIFFLKIYGILHLFAYLCTLELIPLFFLWKILGILSENLIVK